MEEETRDFDGPLEGGSLPPDTHNWASADFGNLIDRERYAMISALCKRTGIVRSAYPCDDDCLMACSQVLGAEMPEGAFDRRLHLLYLLAFGGPAPNDVGSSHSAPREAHLHERMTPMRMVAELDRAYGDDQAYQTGKARAIAEMSAPTVDEMIAAAVRDAVTRTRAHTVGFVDGMDDRPARSERGKILLCGTDYYGYDTGYEDGCATRARLRPWSSTEAARAVAHVILHPPFDESSGDAGSNPALYGRLEV